MIGRRREPKPAAKITAFILIMLYIEYVSETWVTKQLLPDCKQFVSTQFRAYHHFKALFQCLKWDMLKFRCFI